MIVTTDELKEHLSLIGIKIEQGVLERCLLASIEYCENHNEIKYTSESFTYGYFNAFGSSL